MATSITKEFKGFLEIKQKSRLDTIPDQYNRLFMVRLCLICTMVMAISWYSDPISCIVPKSHNIEGKFVSAACWIQGVYVYKQLASKVDKRIAYYGMPKNMDNEGMMQGTEQLCTLKPKLGVDPDPNCKPMTKTFFLQYQYMPFFVATLAIVYYLPYIAFRVLNKDKQLLKEAIKKDDKKAEDIVKSYFRNFHIGDTNKSERRRQSRQMTVRIILNIIVKVLYVMSNIVALLALNNILNDEYVTYGTKFMKWTSLTNTKQHDYMGMRDHPKPGNLLLPPFGYCEMYESARDIKTTLANAHKFVCEISQNILYQYCLIVLWFAIIAGIVISSCGLIHIILIYLIDLIGLRYYRDERDFKDLHTREIELIHYIQQKDVVFYEQIKNLLPRKDERKRNKEDRL